MHQPLRVGWTDWYPYSYRSAGNLTGLDVELTRLILEEAGFTPQFIEMPWARVLREIEFGSIDIGMSANNTEERARYARFSLPYRTEQTALMIHRPQLPQWQHLKGLQELVGRDDFLLGVLKGFDYGETFRPLLADPRLQKQLIVRMRLEPLVRLLLSDRIQGIIIDPGNLITLRQSALPLDELYPLITTRATPVHLIMSLASTDERQKARIDASIRALLVDKRRYENILKRFGAEIPPLPIPAADAPPAHGASR
ncbi:substrate-binding periplasmic protein [Aeromonas schubertii]|uniref:substrate-binding periplasmic protein n=1 Tax=Aeromonas schubertii TaxID=652 RepID=UPI001CC66AC9|nr:transporter substrate-binding domain-containing protein [Aeromonas schubertii]MBZ6071744.1 transporter substrate-binding domain-containing protein [Aeromonas schubertii]